MEIKGRLGVQFFNLGQARFDNNFNNPDDVNKYQRVKRCWNIYFHGFNDRYDDIAYVKEPTTIEPGIYEVVIEGIPCYLFLWQYESDPEFKNNLKGLIVKVDDRTMVSDAYNKYKAGAYFI